MALLAACGSVDSGLQTAVQPTPTAPAATVPITPTNTATATATLAATQSPPATITPVHTATATATPVATTTSTATAAATATATPTATATAVPATAVNAAPTSPPGEVLIAAVGDIMLDRTLGDVINRGRPAYPFAAVSHWLTTADVTVGNLECALGDIGEPNPDKAYPFRAPPGAAEALALGGFDVVSLANNHAMDYGPESLLQGIDLLHAQAVTPIGAGANATAARAAHIREVNGLRLAFLAYVQVPIEGNGFDVQTWEATADAPGLAWGRPEDVAADVAAVAPQVDHVIVVLHHGIEYLRVVTPEQQALARAAVNAGASLVIGHHAHILQKIEVYKGAVIAYGLGNFAFDIDGEANTAVLHVRLDRDGVQQVVVHPAVVQRGGAPRPATPEEAAVIADLISVPWQLR